MTDAVPQTEIDTTEQEKQAFLSHLEGFANGDLPMIIRTDGIKLTPNQLIEEVRSGTEIGLHFLALYQELMALQQRKPTGLMGRITLGAQTIRDKIASLLRR